MRRIRAPTLYRVKISAKGESLMAKRKLTHAQELREHVNRLAERYAHWEQERRDGCVDPNWSDGVNLNLVRNHIINFKRQIRHTCEEYGLTIPAIYYRPLPPLMSADFFVADGKNYDPQRVARLTNLRSNPAKEQPAKREATTIQLSLF